MERAVGCSHCGLPCPADAGYCCYGCEIAARIHSEGAERHGHLHGVLLFTAVLTMAVMMLSLFLYAEDVYGVADGQLGWLRSAYRIAAAVLATPVLVLGGVPLVRRAIEGLRRGRIPLDALVAIGAIAAWALSIHSLLRGGGVYFDAAATAIVLVTFGRYLEASARSRASRALAPLLDRTRAPFEIEDRSGRVRLAAPLEIEPGDVVRVPVERAVPVDLSLVGDPVDVDLAVIDGEARPAARREGETIPAGAVPVSGTLRGVALRRAAESTLERIASLARALAERPSSLLRLADRFSSAVTPVAAAVAIGAVVFWTTRASFSTGVLRGLAVLLVACPCAYAIAAPLVHWLAMRRAFAAGAVIRGADTIESLARVRAVAFDKTGTLTDPAHAETRAEIVPDVDPDDVRRLVRGLEADSRHPVAMALSRWAGEGPAAVVSGRRFEPGRGVSGTDERGAPVSLARDADDAVTLRRGGLPLARFEVHERLRPEAAEAVGALGDLGIDVFILSGDGPERARRVGDALRIPVQARLDAASKVDALARRGVDVAMVGDGVNDAPAIASAATSFAMDGATDLARGLSGVALLVPDLRLVPWTIGLARRTIARTRNLLLASTAYNVVFVALAAAGALRPVLAGLSMLVSSLLTIAFAARDLAPPAPSPASAPLVLVEEAV